MPSKGGTGPTSNTFTTGDGSSWANSLHRFYKWDTKPDASTSTQAAASTKTSGASTPTPSRSSSGTGFIDRMKNNFNNFMNEVSTGATQFRQRLENGGF